MLRLRYTGTCGLRKGNRVIKTISYWSLPEGGTQPLGSALARAEAHGYAALELTIGPEDTIRPNLSPTECDAIRQQVHDSPILVETVASGMSWSTNPVSDDPAVRRAALAQNDSAIQRAAWLGCDAYLLVPGIVACPWVEEKVRYDHALQRSREMITQLLETCERLGVDLCVENVWNGMFYSPVELQQFVDSFGSERLGVYLDVGNLIGIHQHPPHWIELLGSRIKRVHVKDYAPKQGFCDLLEGDVPWAQTVAALRGIGYDGTVVAEMMPPGEGLLERTSKAMDEILAM